MGGYFRVCLVILLLLMIPTVYADIFINEIMYNPQGNDNNKEYVELYVNGSINLSGYVIEDSSSQDVLELLQFSDSSYVLIVEEGFNYTGINASIYSVGAAIGNNLGNTGDIIILKDLNGTILDTVSYNNSLGGDGNGKALCGFWKECSATPGYENEISVIIWEESPQICDWKIDLGLEENIFLDSVDFSIAVNKINGEEENITVRGEITNIFGKKIKSYKPWTDKRVVNKATKKYSPNLKEGVYQLHFWLENISCDSEFENNEITKLIAVNPLLNADQSSLEIERLYLGNDQEAEWGDQFTVKVNIYKGDETKQSVQLWAEKDGKKISKTTKVLIEDKYKNYPLTLPVQLFANCDGKISDGTALLVLEAFDLHQEQEFKIDGIDKEICKDYIKAVKELKKEFAIKKEVIKEEIISPEIIKKVEEEPEISLPKKLSNEAIVVYESNSSKAQGLIPTLLILTFGLLSVVLVIKR